MATLQRPRATAMLQKIFRGTEQEYERYKKKRRYTPRTITVIERISEEDLIIDKKERQEAITLMREMREEAKKNGMTQEKLNEILNEEN